MKEIFHDIQTQIERIINEEEIAVEVEIPHHLEEDFYSFLTYIKQKIQEIRKETNLSFILAEADEEPELL